MTGMLEGKVALVTGGGNGIGREAALAFAREGARVAVADYEAESARETVAMINGAGGQAISLSGDVTVAAQVQAMLDGAIAAYGRLDCAFNNAGIAGHQVECVRPVDPRVVRKVLRPDDRGQSEGRLAVHEARDPADAGGGRRRDRQYRLDRRA